jgi:hypothetical protein
MKYLDGYLGLGLGLDHPLTLLLNQCLEEDPKLRPQDFSEVLQVLSPPLPSGVPAAREHVQRP